MDAAVSQLAAFVLSVLHGERPSSASAPGLDARAWQRPLLVGLAGSGGSGKTTVAALLAAALRSHVEVSGEINTTTPLMPPQDPTGANKDSSIVVKLGGVHVMGMDGYHFTKAHLRSMPEPDLAFRRRGAEWTFDAKRFAKDVAELATTGTLVAPSFDHGVGDPIEGAIQICATSQFGVPDDSGAQNVTSSTAGTTLLPPTIVPQVVVVYRHVVIIEGLYVLLRSHDDWKPAVDYLDVKAFLSCPLDVSTQRLMRRHMAVWHISENEALDRASGSDRENAVLVLTTEAFADVVVTTSCDDVRFVPSSSHSSDL